MVAKPKQAEVSRLDRLLQIMMALLGLVLILGSLGVVVHGALTANDPAQVGVVEKGRFRSGNGTVVQVEVVNRGDFTAASVEIEGVLEVPGQPEQTASVTIDYLSGHSRRTAALLFEGDARGGTLILGAKGWATP